VRRPSGGAERVLGGLAVQAVSSYLTLIIAGRILGAAEFTGIAALYALLSAVASGLFQPLEQEIARRRGRERETGQVEVALLRRATLAGLGLATGTVALALLLWAPAVRLLGNEALLLAAFCLGLPGYAVCFVVRGMLSGSRRLGRYGLQMAVEGAFRLIGLGVLAMLGVNSAAAFGWLFAAAPWIAVAVSVAGLRRQPAPSSLQAPAAPLLAPLVLLLVSSTAAQLLIGAGPLTAQLLASPVDQARTGAFLAALVVVRLPVLLFSAVQPSVLPALSAHTAAGRRVEFGSLLRRVLAGTTLLGVVNLIGFTVLGPWVVRLAFGADFTLPAGVFALMALSVGFFLTGLVLGQGVLALGEHRSVSVGWLLGLVGLVAGLGLGDDPILRAILGLLVGGAFVTASFAFRLLRTLRRWQAGTVPDNALANPVVAS
jgi:O-antigen/teichoic acid export membrane protein